MRISGVIMPNKKHINIALTEIYGIGIVKAKEICKEANIDLFIKVCNIKDEDFYIIQKIIDKYEVEGDLRRRIAINIKRLKDIKCYRGIRHRLSLPVRGQRTKTNAKTRKKKKFKKVK